MVHSNKSINSIIQASLNLEHVKINLEKTKIFAQKIKHNKFIHWTKKMPNEFQTFYSKLNYHEEQDINSLFNILSFFYADDWKVEFEGHIYNRGSYNLIAALIKAYLNGQLEFENYNHLEKMNINEIKNILKGDQGELPLLEKRLERVNRFGEFMNKHKNYENILKKRNNNALELVDYLIEELSFLEDNSYFKGQKVYFNKQTQLWVNGINQVNKNQGKNEINNIKLLGVCCDYRIPTLQRYYGLIEYSEELNEIIDNNYFIKAKSEHENSIRIASGAQMIITANLLNEEYMNVNDMFWILAGELIKITQNHKTITTNY